MRRPAWIIVALLVLGLWLWSQQRGPVPAAPGNTPAPVLSDAPPAQRAGAREAAPRYPGFLPAEAHDVLQRIARGGPFEYRQDGGVFQNREQRLPSQPRGYYREYTVDTPGSSDRGARRIITGGQPPREYWYTDDHYRSFRSFRIEAPEVSP